MKHNFNSISLSSTLINSLKDDKKYDFSVARSGGAASDRDLEMFSDYSLS